MTEARLAPGDLAPDFTLHDQDDNPVTLSSLRGSRVVLYFYPEAMTPGCTTEACDFRDEHSALQKSGAVVLGVSPDDEKSHQKFVAKHSLPFTLLVDTDHALAEKYGAWGEKNMYGRTTMGVIRSTVVIDPQGKVAHHWPKVKAAGHADAVKEKLKELRGAKK
jgi:peroxiredoxin Q/BCP